MPKGKPLLHEPDVSPRSHGSINKPVLKQIGSSTPPPAVYLTAAEARMIADLLDDLTTEPSTLADRRLRQRIRLASNLLWERGAADPSI